MNTSAEPVLEGLESSKNTGSSRRAGGSAKRRGRSREPAAPARFFLGKAGSNGLPVLDKEFPSEGEVMIESLKSGLSYFVVSEWQATADLTKATPKIRRQAAKKQSS